ncbi:hypothetical protein SUTMEG_07650 [Sutterella megalosphaeroides]|uniref:Transmembrane protein n=1 Tax=Sutterella megalosphaeroides TaxID=2494234 RepID=A0A2Z6I949_9BURK|nr:hypothetical protein SUTMEG_07650 [Sutterella megalosphaeroides]
MARATAAVATQAKRREVAAARRANGLGARRGVGPLFASVHERSEEEKRSDAARTRDQIAARTGVRVRMKVRTGVGPVARSASLGTFLYFVLNFALAFMFTVAFRTAFALRVFIPRALCHDNEYLLFGSPRPLQRPDPAVARTDDRPSERQLSEAALSETSSL